MIKREIYNSKMREAKLLLNASILVVAVDAIYDRIKDKYIQQDFDYAVETMIERGEKISYPVLKKYLERFKEVRLDTERQMEKAKIKRDILNMPRVAVPVVEMIKAVLSKDVIALEKYGLNKPFLKGNAVIITEDRRRKNVIVDRYDEGFLDSLIRSKEQAGENIIDVAYITKGTKYQELSKMVVEENVPVYRDEDFIPEEEGWGH